MHLGLFTWTTSLARSVPKPCVKEGEREREGRGRGVERVQKPVYPQLRRPLPEQPRASVVGMYICSTDNQQSCFIFLNNGKNNIESGTYVMYIMGSRRAINIQRYSAETEFFFSSEKTRGHGPA